MRAEACPTRLAINGRWLPCGAGGLPFGAGGGSRIAGHMGRALRSRMGRALRSRMGRALRSRMGRALRSRTLQSEDRCLRRFFFPRHAVPAQVAGSCIAGRDRCLRRSFSTQHGQSQGSRRIVRSRAWQVGQVRGLRRSFSHPTRQSDRSGACGAPFFHPTRPIAGHRGSGDRVRSRTGQGSALVRSNGRRVAGRLQEITPPPPLLGTDDLTRPATRELSARDSAVRPSSAATGKNHGSFRRCPRPADRRLRAR
jgi:hypothetical protein